MEKVNGKKIRLYSQLSVSYKSVFDIVLAQESRLKDKDVTFGASVYQICLTVSFSDNQVPE